MIKVLIVDDEITARNGLLRHIQWTNLEVDKVDAVATAESAIQYIEEEKPDIVISDIRMPRMNGIELCSIIKQLHSSCRIIFLSGYSDKEYLKGAIQLSADAYVEKPVNLQEMEDCILKSVRKCIEEKNKRNMETELLQYVEKSQQKIQEEIIKNLSKGKFEQVQLSKLKPKTEFILSPDMWYSCVILQLNKENSYSNNASENLFEEIKKLLVGIKYLAAIKDERYIIIIFSFTNNEILTKKSMVYSNLTNFIENPTLENIHIFGVLGDYKKGYFSIQDLYNDATILLQKGFYLGYDKVVYQKEEKNKNFGFYSIDNSNFDFLSFKAALSEKNLDEVNRIAKKIYEYFISQKNILPNVVKNVLFELTYMVYQEAEKIKGGFNLADQSEQEFLWARINEFETIFECYQYLNENIHMLFENRDGLISDNRLILSIIEYINNHFKEENLSIKQIADSVYLSSPYLSSLFKNKTGKTIGQYIKDIRLEYSLVLMEDKRLMLYDIASMCGYSDSNYYAKVFKKKYKMSPSEYRERIIK